MCVFGFEGVTKTVSELSLCSQWPWEEKAFSIRIFKDKYAEPYSTPTSNKQNLPLIGKGRF